MSEQKIRRPYVFFLWMLSLADSLFEKCQNKMPSKYVYMVIQRHNWGSDMKFRYGGHEVGRDRCLFDTRNAVLREKGQTIVI
jgi:hypothetical protein